jgi:hypothetical protein
LRCFDPYNQTLNFRSPRGLPSPHFGSVSFIFTLSQSRVATYTSQLGTHNSFELPLKNCKPLWCSYVLVSSTSVFQNTSIQDALDFVTHLVLWLDLMPLHQKHSCKRIKGYQGIKWRKPTMTKHMVKSSLSTYWINCETKFIIYLLSWFKLCKYKILKAPLPNTSS